MDPVMQGFRVFLSASTDEMSMNGAQSQRQLVKQTVMILNRRVNMNNTFKQLLWLCWCFENFRSKLAPQRTF